MVKQIPLNELFEGALAGKGAVAEWERTFARWCGVKYAFGTASGTMALYLALKAVGVGIGDEVVVPALDWYAATAAVLHLGAIPVFADIESNSPTISPKSVQERVTEKTKAIVATHLFGYPCDMPALRHIADQKGIALVEDAAQALGASCDGRKVGAWGDVACFSFGVGKLISCGEGGMVVTSSEEIAERLLMLSTHPLRQQWNGLEVHPFALKAPLNPLATMRLLEEWQELEERLRERQEAFQRLNAVLRETGKLSPICVREGCQQGYHKFVATVQRRGERNSLLRRLWEVRLPASASTGAELIPAVLKKALNGKQIWWHPLLERIVASRAQPCPCAEDFSRRAICVDWRIGKDEEKLTALRSVLAE